MATAQTFIDNALYEIGAYQPGETPSSEDRTTGLFHLGNMIDSWGADLLTIFTTQRTLYTLLSGTSSVTIGPSGTINTTRPMFWIGVNYVVPGTNPAVETPMGRMDDDSFMNLAIKGLPSNLPTQWYYNQTFPLGTLFFWPTVTQNVQLALYFSLAVAVPTALSDTVEGPPGYKDGIHYGLSFRLCNAFEKEMPPLLPKLMNDAWGVMRRPNVDPGLLGIDAALVPQTGSGYNVYNDNSSSPSGR